MAAKRELTMLQIRELLRLAQEGVGLREIARRLGVARSTIHDNLNRLKSAGLSWPLPPELHRDEIALEKLLFSHSSGQAGARRREEPDWATLARELKCPGVNMPIRTKAPVCNGIMPPGDSGIMAPPL